MEIGPDIDIGLESGDAAWPKVEPLMQAAWPDAVRATLPWGHIVFAHADFRVLVEREDDGVVGHVGIYRRRASLNGRPVHIGGIGGVVTRADHRRRGYATVALNAAIATLKHEGSIGFGLLFCAPHNEAFYRARGWHDFAGEVVAEQPGGQVRFDVMKPMVFDLVLRPRSGTLDLHGLPW
ncbi:MAG: GNAT family N-acetyltransferase [Xanthobacteraceae bacterium]|nr:GNAT family N-acetyltransferase [Xanthobacteraceae bacterium]